MKTTNKILITSSFVLLGLSSIAFANGTNEKTNAPTTTFQPGIYIGLQAGYGLAHWKDSSGQFYNDAGDIISVSQNSDNGLVGRIFTGYDFNKNFALEMGYMRFLQKTKSNFNGVETNQVVTQSMDLLGKGTIPINDSLSVYAKLGLNYSFDRFDKTNSTYDSTFYNSNFIGITYGAGISYNITSNLITDVSWLHYDSCHHNYSDIDGNNYQPNPDLFLLGISYKFNL